MAMILLMNAWPKLAVRMYKLDGLSCPNRIDTEFLFQTLKSEQQNWPMCQISGKLYKI